MQLHELPQGGPEGQLIASRGSWLNPAAVGAPPRRLCRYVLSLAAAVDVRWYTLVDMGAATGQVVLLLLVHPETGELLSIPVPAPRAAVPRLPTAFLRCTFPLRTPPPPVVPPRASKKHSPPPYPPPVSRLPSSSRSFSPPPSPAPVSQPLLSQL